MRAEDLFLRSAGPAEWVEQASADNAVATATRAAEAGKRHYVAAIGASFSAALVKLLQLKFGAVVKAEHYVHNLVFLTFENPIEVDENTAVSAELAASGAAGTIGKVFMAGFTR